MYVADVSGKGLSAALMMAALSAKIRSIAPLHNEIDKLLTNVNNEMHELMSDEGFFATMLLVDIGPRQEKCKSPGLGTHIRFGLPTMEFGNFPKLGGLSVGVEFGTEYEKTEFAL